MAIILRHDVRTAVRLLRRRPAFAWSVVITMGLASGFLGVAANLATSLVAPYVPVHPSTLAAADSSSLPALLPVAVVLLLAGGMVLAGACANLATLSMSHYQTRGGEFAVRASIGGTPRQLARQLGTEGLALSFGACVLGGVFAFWTRQVMFSWLSPEQAATVEPGMTVGATLAASAVSVLACAITLTCCARAAAGLGWPLIRGGGGSLAVAARGSRPGRMVVIAQVATACSLLAAATLLGDGMDRALQLGPGTTAHEVAVVHTIAPTRYEDRARGRRFQLQALERLSAMPGINSAAATSALPLVSAMKIGYALDAGGPFAPFQTITVSSRYFATMQHPILEGREFDSRHDTIRPDAAVINQALARVLFPTMPAIGQHLSDDNGQQLTVIGVVADARYRHMAEPVKPTVYIPLSSRYLSGFHFVARATGDATPRVAAVAETLQAIDSARLERQTTLDQHLQGAVRRERVAMTFVAACGLLILVFAVSGPYLLTRQAVTSRYDELAVRLAFGARGQHIFGLVIAQAARSTLIGVLVGESIALALAALVADATGVTAGAASLTVLTIGVVLVALSAIAATVPALRAYRLSPAAALR
jgi:predicted permease